MPRTGRRASEGKELITAVEIAESEDYQSDRPKNALEKKGIESTREKTGRISDLELLQKTFDRMK